MTSPAVRAAPVPLVDLTPWWTGDPAARREVARAVDDALRTSGFLLVSGHGVPDWLPPGAEANGAAEGTVTPPDMKESWSAGADDPSGDPARDAAWFALVSLVFFYELDPDTVVEALGPPVGQVPAAPVRAADYLAEKLAAITVS